jgi:hypothetical protein
VIAAELLIALERALAIEYPRSFRAAWGELVGLVETAEFAKTFPDTRLLLTASQVEAAREQSDRSLVPFMFSAQIPDVYAFDLRSEGPEYEVVVWAVHTAVQRWDGFGEFLAWARRQCSC